MLGIGIISIRNAQGNKHTRMWLHPKNKITSAASVTSREKRARNSSAPSDPTIRIIIAVISRSRPDHDPCGRNDASWWRWSQSTYAENIGTKKPWEKLGSCHHCVASLLMIGK